MAAGPASAQRALARREGLWPGGLEHMDYYTYVLESMKDGKLYIGSTNNLRRRLNEHNNGKSVSTKYRRPFKLVYFEVFASFAEARGREKLFKKSHSILYRAANWLDTHT